MVPIRVTEEVADTPGAEPTSWLFEEFTDDSHCPLALAITLTREAQRWRKYNALFETRSVRSLCAHLEEASKQVTDGKLSAVRVGDLIYRTEKV